MKTLAPGEEVTIRAAARWPALNQDDQMPIKISLRAQFTYLFHPVSEYSFDPSLSDPLEVELGRAGQNCVPARRRIGLIWADSS